MWEIFPKGSGGWEFGYPLGVGFNLFGGKSVKAWENTIKGGLRAPLIFATSAERVIDPF